MSRFEILGSEANFCVMHTNLFLVLCHPPSCIISLMDAQKHVFGVIYYSNTWKR